MYAARDITNTVGCLGLIVSSIISKKVTGSLSLYCTVLYCTVYCTHYPLSNTGLQVAEGLSALVLDVKWGEGCYQAERAQAERLAEVLVQVDIVDI